VETLRPTYRLHIGPVRHEQRPQDRPPPETAARLVAGGRSVTCAANRKRAPEMISCRSCAPTRKRPRKKPWSPSMKRSVNARNCGRRRYVRGARPRSPAIARGAAKSSNPTTRWPCPSTTSRAASSASITSATSPSSVSASASGKSRSTKYSRWKSKCLLTAENAESAEKGKGNFDSFAFSLALSAFSAVRFFYTKRRSRDSASGVFRCTPNGGLFVISA